MPKRTPYQQRIIRNYYENRESIAVQRLQELVTELYLTEGKKRQRHWKSVRTHLENLGVKPEQIEQLVSADDPELVAKYLKSLMKDA